MVPREQCAGWDCTFVLVGPYLDVSTRRPIPSATEWTHPVPTPSLLGLELELGPTLPRPGLGPSTSVVPTQSSVSPEVGCGRTGLTPLPRRGPDVWVVPDRTASRQG